VYFVDPHLRTPYTVQYNLSVQRELTSRLVAEVSYVGSSTRKQTALVDSNPFAIGTYKRVFNTQAGVPSYGFSYLDTFGNFVNARYDSLQASLTKQLTQNSWIGSSYFTLSYTWGKSIDNASGFRNNSGRVPSWDHGYFRAVSDYDLPHRVVFSGGWDLPFNQMFANAPRKLTKGWSLYPILTWRGGFPQDIRAQFSRSRTRVGTSGYGDGSLTRVNLIGNSVNILDPKNPSTLNLYFNPTDGVQFTTAGLHTSYQVDGNGDPCTKATVVNCFNPVLYPDQRTYGSLPRDFFRGPSRGNFDLALAKKTPIHGERLQAEFRAEFFNILNHAEFDDPITNVADKFFGQITTTAPPRIIQLALRFSF
jgi:hypothetical protein